MNHKDLDVWRNSIDFIVCIYRLTESFPPGESYALTQQLRRAAISIASNIAEGSARNSDKELIRFLYYSLGSVSEIETQLIIGHRLNYFKDLNDYLEKLLKVKQPIIGLIKHQKKRINKVWRATIHASHLPPSVSRLVIHQPIVFNICILFNGAVGIVVSDVAL